MNNLLAASETAKIFSKITKYHIGSNSWWALLFEILLWKAIIDTRDKVSNRRENIPSLNTYISRVKSDIDKFNEYAKINYEALTTWGERYNNIMPNLFKGYLAAGREYFVKHTQYQKDKYGYGENIDKDKLMMLALNKY